MRVAVLGGGIQGVCVALELATRGVIVDLYDRASTCMTGASLNNEGKLHLGYVYASDTTLQTAELMIKGSLSFGHILRRYIGNHVDLLPVSRPFTYLVHHDSQLHTNDVSLMFSRVHECCVNGMRAASAGYFGRHLSRPPTRFRTVEEAGFSSDRVAAAFGTQEIALEPQAVAEALRQRVSETGTLTTRYDTRVLGVYRDKGLRVEATTNGASSSDQYDHVVNALWDGRLAVDNRMGLHPSQPWLLRYKEYLQVQVPHWDRLLCATIILGAFGDIVSYPSGYAYLSWYPIGRRISTPDLVPPDEQTLLTSRKALAVKTATFRALSEIAPQLRALSPRALATSVLRGGWIFAWGNSDIDDPKSQLHERHKVGPSSHDGYHTIDTGKYCLAPLFALRVADAITAA